MAKQEKTEQQKFLDQFDGPSNGDPFAQFNTVPPENTGGENGDEGAGAGEPTVEEKEAQEQELRNRRERRLSAKLDAERKSSMEMAELLRQERARNADTRQTDRDYLKSVERIYGDATPENKEATEILKNSLRSLEDAATERALERFKEIQRQEKDEERKAAQELDTMLEELEDDYKVDLTSNTTDRQNFLKLLEKMSPKDEHGQIERYADHHSVYEIFKAQKTTKPDTRTREISGRSMTQSGQAATVATANVHGELDEATVKYLIDHDLI